MLKFSGLSYLIRDPKFKSYPDTVYPASQYDEVVVSTVRYRTTSRRLRTDLTCTQGVGSHMI
jgi:hypothetical protein